MILHLVRHPKPAIAPGICYGQLDISAENVAAVAIGLRDKLPPGLPVWSSPLQRGIRFLASKSMPGQPMSPVMCRRGVNQP